MLGFIVFEPFIIREVEFFDQDQDHDHDDLLRAHPWFLPPHFVPSLSRRRPSAKADVPLSLPLCLLRFLWLIPLPNSSFLLGVPVPLLRTIPRSSNLEIVLPGQLVQTAFATYASKPGIFGRHFPH